MSQANTNEQIPLTTNPKILSALKDFFRAIWNFLQTLAKGLVSSAKSVFNFVKKNLKYIIGALLFTAAFTAALYLGFIPAIIPASKILSLVAYPLCTLLSFSLLCAMDYVITIYKKRKDNQISALKSKIEGSNEKLKEFNLKEVTNNEIKKRALEFQYNTLQKLLNEFNSFGYKNEIKDQLEKMRVNIVDIINKQYIESDYNIFSEDNKKILGEEKIKEMRDNLKKARIIVEYVPNKSQETSECNNILTENDSTTKMAGVP